MGERTPPKTLKGFMLAFEKKTQSWKVEWVNGTRNVRLELACSSDSIENYNPYENDQSIHMTHQWISEITSSISNSREREKKNRGIFLQSIKRGFIDERENKYTEVTHFAEKPYVLVIVSCST